MLRRYSGRFLGTKKRPCSSLHSICSPFSTISTGMSDLNFLLPLFFFLAYADILSSPGWLSRWLQRANRWNTALGGVILTRTQKMKKIDTGIYLNVLYHEGMHTHWTLTFHTLRFPSVCRGESVSLTVSAEWWFSLFFVLPQGFVLSRLEDRWRCISLQARATI